jgi:hydrogenase maturation protease
MNMQKILIYGIGNPYRCDDAAGIIIAEELRKRISMPNITIRSGSIDGLSMLEEIVGFDKVVFIDSIKTKNGKPGDIYKINLNQSETNPPIAPTHGIDFVRAIKMGKKFDCKIPEKIVIFAIEIEDNTSFSQECTNEVKTSIPEVVEKILSYISK